MQNFTTRRKRCTLSTTADFTTRTRDEMFSIYVAYQGLQRRIQDMVDEVAANGGATGIYGTGGVNWPAQGDAFSYADMVAAFTAITSLVGVPSVAQKNAIIKARR